MARIISENDLRLTSPCRMIVNGQSGVGKSYFTVTLINNRHYMFQKPVDKVIYFYNELNPTIRLLEKDPSVSLIHGFDYEMLLENPPSRHLLVIVDDHLNANCYDKLSELFAVKSRALNISCCLLTQNLFTKSGNAKSYNRDILINSTHSCIFNNKRDKLGVMAIARASFPTKYRYFMDSYYSACEESTDGRGYLFLSLSPESKPEIELRTKIFYRSELTILFWPK